MEEITTRFEIIRLAVPLGDFRTIDLQCEKLRSLGLDEKLHEIIELLESRNYRQALYEMKHYTLSLKDDFFSPETTEKTTKHSDLSRTEAGLFDLETQQNDEEEEEQVLNLEDILRLSGPADNRVTEYRPAPGFGTEASDDVMSTGSHSRHDDDERTRETDDPFALENWRNVAEDDASEKTRASMEAGQVPRHPPISYINQKFRNMIHQFPPVEEETPLPEEVEAMQRKISTEGYTEEEIESFLGNYRSYKEAGRRGEAALVLLLAAATESKFAQFMLARELFRGEIIRQDHAEAFTQINTLADQNFAEAICDLGQFYEHGVGIGKDRQMALLLYEEAAEMGIARARKHYERLKNSRGLKGLFKKVSLPKVALPLPKKS